MKIILGTKIVLLASLVATGVVYAGKPINITAEIEEDTSSASASSEGTSEGAPRRKPGQRAESSPEAKPSASGGKSERARLKGEIKVKRADLKKLVKEQRDKRKNKKGEGAGTKNESGGGQSSEGSASELRNPTPTEGQLQAAGNISLDAI